ncbi:MAG: bifunctional oligoribonuclease/PAP phosphatase NrnA [Firmicutes bacterium]|nr:bifunctional oligoribonuclease/PAP phosphatase NrnA [Bacillota bacterium]
MVVTIKRDIYKKIFKIIKDYDEIIIARHIGPDPDAIASQIALRDSIRLTFPDKEVYAVGAGVHKFKYLGSLDKIELESFENALLIVLDVPNFIRIDGIESLKYQAILKIDHHPQEDIIGDVDWTDENMSSTCEMITNLILETRLVLDTKIAENLYTGMVFDSDRFLLQNTSVETFKTVAKLLETSKINFVPLYDNLYERSIIEEKFRAYLINNLTISENGFGFINVTDDALKKYNVEAVTVSNQVNDFYFIKELICWVFVVFDERNQIYKVNIRSRGPIINEIANKYNGGGHKLASGARLKNYKDVESLAKELDEVCKNYLIEENK